MRADKSKTERLNAGHAAAKLFANYFLKPEITHIGCYYGKDDEFNCEPIIKLILKDQKKCFLPVICNDDKNLDFVSYQENDALVFNRYHILEPQNKNKIKVEDLDLVIVPLVGFDKKGNRLGMGGGFYDRTFSFLLNSKISKPMLVGLGFASQEVDFLPQNEWDVPLKAIITEKKITFLQ